MEMRKKSRTGSWQGNKIGNTGSLISDTERKAEVFWVGLRNKSEANASGLSAILNQAVTDDLLFERLKFYHVLGTGKKEGQQRTPK